MYPLLNGLGSHFFFWYLNIYKSTILFLFLFTSFIINNVVKKKENLIKKDSKTNNQ